MRYLSRLQLLTCLLVYAPSAHSIMVKFGTKDGPIEPPTPEPEVVPLKPYRTPAPVWEPRANDRPDPNAEWRPQLFVPHPRYTQVAYNPFQTVQSNIQYIPNRPSKPLEPEQPSYQPLKPSQPAESTAQRFVNAYLQRHRPVKAEPIKNYFTPSQMISQLSAQNLPGFGLRYFVPVVRNDQNRIRAEDAKLNELETNEIDRDDNSDTQWKYEKIAARMRTPRHTDVSPVPYVYQWPVYVHRRQ